MSDAGETTGKRLILCLDGTWNNAYQEKERDDGSKVFKPSNPLKTCRAARALSADGKPQITYYDAGVGALNTQPGVSNRVLKWVDNKLGGVWGAGFENNIEDAYYFLVHNHVPGDEVYVFGFSRGAAQARGLCRFIDWMGGVPTKGDAYWIPIFFRNYLEHRGRGSGELVRAELNAEREGRVGPIDPVRVRYLGVWDTVMALGARLESHEGTSVRQRSFHVGPSPAGVVEVAHHALAIDEKRYDFRPEIWRRPAHENQVLEQRWFPGVHSNVGGGYVHDGLANSALRWVLAGAESAGLELDHGFLRHYRGYGMDQLIESRTTMYKLLEARLWLTGKGRAGVRALDPFAGGEESAPGFTLDDSVFHRLAAAPKERDAEGKPRHKYMHHKYRPKNLLAYLAAHPELDEQLPEGVLKKVRKLRPSPG